MTTELQVSELFYSLQGESTRAGLPCFFIRLAGCNLRCSYCDARYSYEDTASAMALDAIVAAARHYPDCMVEITGGEPLLQQGTVELCRQLVAHGRTVLLETNGSLSLAAVPAPVVKIVDIKCPDSGMADHFLEDNLTWLTPQDEIKFVLGSRTDYQWARQRLQDYDLGRHTVLFSPVTSRLPPRQLADWILADRLPVRLQLQLHTLLWPEKTRGA